MIARFVAVLLFAGSLSLATHAQVRIKGTIGPGGYRPPDGAISVTWRRPGAPDVVKRLNQSVEWVGGGGGDVNAFYCRYAECDRSVQGAQITVIQSEQLGLRAGHILKELYRQAGLSREPCPGTDWRCQEIWDFAIVNAPRDRPMNWCDFIAFTGKPDPICKDRCPPCAGQPGTSIPRGALVEAPTEAKREGTRVSFKWPGEGTATVTVNTKRGGEIWQLHTSRLTGPTSARVEIDLPAETARETVILYVSQRKKQAAEVIFEAPGTPDPIPPPPPPPVDDLDRRLEEFWRLRLKPLLRELYTPGVPSTGSVKVSVFEEKAATRGIRKDRRKVP